MVERMVLSLLMSGLVGEWSSLLGGILVAGKVRGFLCEISFCLVTHLHFEVIGCRREFPRLIRSLHPLWHPLFPTIR